LNLEGVALGTEPGTASGTALAVVVRVWEEMDAPPIEAGNVEKEEEGTWK